MANDPRIVITPREVVLLAGITLLLAGGFATEGYLGSASALALGGAWAAVLGALALLPGGASPHRLGWSALGFFLVPLGVGALLLAPLPADATLAISPRWREWAAAREAAGLDVPGLLPLAFEPHRGWESWGRWLSAGGFFAACLVLCRRRKPRRLLLVVVASVGVIEGWWAFSHLAVGGAGRAHGALFNPNHSAALILMIAPVAAGMIIGRWQREGMTRNRGGSNSRDRWLLLGGFAAIGILGWAATISRASMLAAIVVLLPWLGWEIAAAKRRRSGWKTSTIIKRVVGGLALVVVLLWFSGATDLLAHRFGGGLEDYGRLDLWAATWREWIGTRLVGFGPGGTEVALEMALGDVAVRKSPIHTHNDALQWVAEFGLAGIAGVVAWKAMMARALRTVSLGDPRLWISSERLADRAIMAGIATVLIHSMVDFPLRVPLAGYCFLALVAVLISRLTCANNGDSHPERSTSNDQ